MGGVRREHRLALFVFHVFVGCNRCDRVPTAFVLLSRLQSARLLEATTSTATAPCTCIARPTSRHLEEGESGIARSLQSVDDAVIQDHHYFNEEEDSLVYSDDDDEESIATVTSCSTEPKTEEPETEGWRGCQVENPSVGDSPT